jgi:hypothetical protein
MIQSVIIQSVIFELLRSALDPLETRFSGNSAAHRKAVAPRGYNTRRMRLQWEARRGNFALHRQGFVRPPTSARR